MARIRIVLTGPECTGKTTLAARLAAQYGAPWVAEAARRYVETVTPHLSAATVEPIARLAMALADEACGDQVPPDATADTAVAGAPGGRAASGLCVFDTDLVSTVVYARHYYGACPPWIEREARARLGDLYLLGAPDLPWTPDGVRDRPDRREELFEAFATLLEDLGARVVVLRGQGEVRTAAAVRAIEALLHDRTG